MTAKFTRGATSWYNAPANTNLTIPNSDWSLGFSFILDGATTGNVYEYAFSTGLYQKAGSVNLMYATTDHSVAADAGRLCAYIDGASIVNVRSPVLEVGKAYQAVFYRSGTTVAVKICPVLTTLPTTGAAVLTGISPITISNSMYGGSFDIGVRADGDAVRAFDHSGARFFLINSVLPDLDIAKLAYGMEITELGYTPLWYARLNDSNDFIDRGSLAVPFAKNGNIANGSSLGYGYVPTVSAPAFSTAPAINGTVQVGTTVTYTAGTAAGNPTPTSTQQWYIAGVAVSGATGATYIPVAGDVGKALTVRQTATNSQGTAFSESAAKTVSAAANAIALTPLTAEKIYPRNGTTAAVAMAGTYTGTQPSSIEYQLYAIDGTTVRQAWTSASATIVAGGTWTAAPLVPQHLEKYTIAVRAKDSGGTVLSTSVTSANRFGVGFNIACIGSSTVSSWFGSGSGGSFTPNNTSTSYCDASGFRNFDNNGAISTAASYFAAQFGCAVGMINAGYSGETATNFASQGSAPYNLMVNDIALAGNRLEGLFCSVGSNDASNTYLVTSVAQHLGKLRTIISTVRTQCSQPNMPVMWVGMNPRPGSSGNAAGQDPMSDWVRQAETILGDDPNVYHVQCIDFAAGPDGVHLPGGGFQAQIARMQYVWVEAIKNGVYRRGPKITSFSFVGNAVTAALQYRNGSASDFTPTTGAVGFTVTDASGTPTIASVTRTDATHVKITCDRTLVAPVVAKYLSGGAPSTSAPIFDNGSVALPLTMDSVLATTAGTLPADTQAPTLTNASATQTGSTTATGSVTTDEANGTLYYLVNNSATATAQQVQAGSTKAVTATGVQSVSFTGLPAATLLYPHFVHVDAALNVSTVANGAGFTTAAAPDTTAPTLSAASATATGTTTATGSVTTNEANGTLYWLVSTSASVTAAQVKAGASQAITTAGAKTVSATGLPSATAQYFYFLHRDAANNDSEVLQSPVFTTSAVAPPQGNGQSGVTFIPSKARTLKVKAAALTFEGGAFWDMANPRKPSGRKDPDSIIDITLDWSDVLDDISDTIAGIDWFVKNASSTGSYPAGALTTLFVAGGTVSTVIEITATMTTASNPPRKEDRTVYLKVEQL